MKTKVCTKCHKRLSIKKFQLSRNTKDGLQCHCKDCRRKYTSKDGKGYKVFREYQNSYQNNYYHSHKKDKKYMEMREKSRQKLTKQGYFAKYQRKLRQLRKEK